MLGNPENIEVGDIVRFSWEEEGNMEVTKVDSPDRDGDIKLYYKRANGSHDWGYIGTNFKVVTKKELGKIIGYKLLKDTPDSKAGTKFLAGSGRFIKEGVSDYAYHAKDVENNPTWFEPIYEVVKPTEVKVMTNAGEVTVTKDVLSIGSETFATKNFQHVAKFSKSAIALNMYDIKVETFKVGCKTFHVNDIPKLEEAIKQVS